MKFKARFLAAGLLALACLPWLAASAQTVEYIHTDALGTPIAVTNASRVVIERSEYEPYGKLLNRPLTDGPGFTGHVQDAATGMTYMQQRYYDPMIGRFLSVDPVTAYSNGDWRFFNRYAYAFNNPYRFTDPDGRQSVGEMIDSGAEGCGAVSCAGWAALSATWKVLGAEGVSQIADKGWSGAGGGDKGGAALEVASVIPFVKAARAVAPIVRGGAEMVRIGQAGERAVRAAVDIGPKVGIKVNGVSRIPDGLTDTAVNEVKNVASLSYTSQLRDFAQFAKDTGREFNLYVRPGAKLSEPLLKAREAGDVIIHEIPFK